MQTIQELATKTKYFIKDAERVIMSLIFSCMFYYNTNDLFKIGVLASASLIVIIGVLALVFKNRKQRDKTE